MAKAYVEARQQHGKSELLDEISRRNLERGHPHYHSPEELKQHGLRHLRDSVACLRARRRRQRSTDFAGSSSRCPRKSQLLTESMVKQ